MSDPRAAQPALDHAASGDTICFTGPNLSGLELAMRTSGTEQRPILLVADGATLRTLDVVADYVVVEGFTLADGDGLSLEGTGLVALDNLVRNAAAGGIVCTNCLRATLESNTVWRADGTGLLIDGAESVVRGNTITDSVRIKADDADGIRFFGNGLRITGNTIKNITTTGYRQSDAPHTDCFQTYGTGSRATYDVVIADNVCENVDVQCLIATGGGATGGADADRASSASILFEGNTCSVRGAQAVLIEHFPDVVIRGNVFRGPQYRAVFLAKGSTNAAVVENTVVGDIPPFEVDDHSSSGFHAEGNTSR